MENSIKKKINTFGKVAKIITTIIIVFLLVAEGFLLVGGIVVAAVPKDSVTVDVSSTADIKVNTGYFGLDDDDVYVKAGDTKVYVGNVSTDEVTVVGEDGIMNMNANVRDMHFDLTSALLMILFGMISIASTVVALYFFKALTKQFMVCDSPFCDGVVKKMHNFAVALIPCMAVSMLMKAAMEAVISSNFNMDIDFKYVAFVCIIFVLTMVFKYGTELQKEHDETV